MSAQLMLLGAGGGGGAGPPVIPPDSFPTYSGAWPGDYSFRTWLAGDIRPNLYPEQMAGAAEILSGTDPRASAFT